MNTIQKAINIYAPASKVWDSITKPELIQKWMTDSEIEILSGWQTGSPIIFKGDLHGISFINKGIILQFKPGKILSYTFWSSLTEHADVPENYSVITFDLTASADITTLAFIQTNIVAEAQLRHVNYYWEVALELIKKLNES
jgi:uncharacterized protein YndB with AHSA1/START domain